MPFADWGLSSGGAYAGSDDWGSGGGGSVLDPSWIMAGSNVLGRVLSGSPAAPAFSSNSSRNDQVFDNSGWLVTFGNENDVAADLRRSSERSDTAGLDLTGGGTLQTLLIVAAGVLLWRKLRKS